MSTVPNVKAQEPIIKDENKTISPYKELNKNFQLVNEKSINLDNTNNKLYWEFDNKQSAFITFKEIASNVLNTLQRNYNLSTLNESNWKQYQDKFLEYYDRSEIFESKELTLVDEFFTVCENHEINTDIMNMYKKKSINLMDIVYCLPYTSPILDKIQFTAFNVPETRLGNLTAANNYAKTYAKNPNTKSYNYYAGKDCTNFVSQILKAGGKKTDSDWKPYNSRWINAHSFVLYWYMKTNASNGYPSFHSISGTVRSGDVIGADWQGDGRYDHNAYVYASGSKTSKGYYDITIAQHSSNYCAKVSSSENGWESHKTGLYVRLRI